MFMADYHTHSNFSDDGNDSIPALLAAAAKRGLDELCVTDHCDLPYFDNEGYWEVLSAAGQRNDSGVKLLYGIELGQGTHYKTLAKKIVNQFPYDFIIGSLHTLRKSGDIYLSQCHTPRECFVLLDEYFVELLETAEWGGFDVMGHLTYPMRYMTGRDNLELAGAYERYEGRWRTLFEILCGKGLGIELNLSGMYGSGGYFRPMPDYDILALYKRCGGEIVTLGSDSHSPKMVGIGIEYGLELCRRVGFRYVTAYEKRKPRFERI
ncbi:MAG: histidinol-phosphatase HisJ family protein [Oscillospiraceae bacterium]|nr:histidinol-phosphatase HisJ family protein [Oscillospiraceae bacterium]